MEATTTVKRGFAVPCLRCGENSVHVYLDNLTTFHCAMCSEEWTASEAVVVLEQWQRVLAWVEMAPVLDETGG